MAVPVINTTTSILEGTQWQPFNYQPFATETPTAWACPNLPQGLAIDDETGAITGTPEISGVFVCGLVATNGTGDSDPLALTIGIEPGEASLSSSGFTVEVDVSTRVLTVIGAEKLFGKFNDDFLLFVRFKKGEAVLDLDLDSLTLGLKEFIPDTTLVVSTGFAKFGEGSGAYYALTGKLDGNRLKGALSGYAKKKSQTFDASAEIEWVENFTPPSTWAEAPETLRMTTRDIPYQVAAEMVQAA